MIYLPLSTQQQGCSFSAPADFSVIAGTGNAIPIQLPANACPIAVIYKVNTLFVTAGATIQLKNATGIPILQIAAFDLATIAPGSFQGFTFPGAAHAITPGQLFLVISGAYTAGQGSLYIQYTTLE